MLIVGGFRCCVTCARKSPVVDLLDAPGIFNHRSNVRHLLSADRALTLCGRNTLTPEWETPWSEIEIHRLLHFAGWSEQRIEKWFAEARRHSIPIDEQRRRAEDIRSRAYARWANERNTALARLGL